MDKTFEQLGLVMHLAGFSALHRVRSLSSLKAWIEPAIAHRQIRFAFSKLGKPLGYWTWAFLAQDTEARVVRNPDAALHLSEWNEGDRLWIVDLVAPWGHLGDISRHLSTTLFREQDEARFLRRRKDGSARQVAVSRRPRHGSPLPLSGHVLRLDATAFAASHSEWAEAHRRNT